MLFFSFSSTTHASSVIRECIYQANPYDASHNKWTIQIDDSYNATATSVDSSSKLKIKNWNDVKKTVKAQKKCPSYIAEHRVRADDSLLSFLFSKKYEYYVYFSLDEAKKMGNVTELTKDIPLGSEKNNNSDKNNNNNNNSSNNNNNSNASEDVIEEFEKTYYLTSFSSSEYGDTLRFYTKYNKTKDMSLSTQLSLNKGDNSVSLAYMGDVAEFSSEILDPIVKSGKWPSDFYCGKITAYLLLDKSATYVLGDGTGVVCSTEKSAFHDGTNKLVHFQANKKKGHTGSDEWLPEAEGPTKEECKADPNKEGCARNRCEVIRTDGEVFKILKEIIGYVQIGSVFAVLIFCVLDLGGAVASSDDDAFRKARGKVFKRIIALILIFLVPLLVNFVINLVNLGACNDSEEDYDFIGNLFH